MESTGKGGAPKRGTDDPAFDLPGSLSLDIQELSVSHVYCLRTHEIEKELSESW